MNYDMWFEGQRALMGASVTEMERMVQIADQIAHAFGGMHDAFELMRNALAPFKIPESLELPTYEVQTSLITIPVSYNAIRHKIQHTEPWKRQRYRSKRLRRI